MTDDLDAKIARIAARVQSRSDGAREKLAAIGALELATACKERFGARLAFLGPIADCPKGHIYNFDLGTPHDATASPVHGHAPIPSERPRDQPYRGRPNQGKRGTRKAAGKGAGGGQAVAWQHSGRDLAAGRD